METARPLLPSRIFFTLTGNCNLKCKSCYNQQSGNYFSEPELIKVKKIIDRIKEANIPEVVVTGGEPFLCRDIFTIIDYLLLNNFRVRVNTNGLLLSDYHIAELQKRKGVILTIGMDGVSKKTHDFIRGEGNFDKVLIILRKLSNAGVKLYINFTATQVNLADIWRLEKFFREFGVLRVIVNIFIRAGKGYEHRELLSPSRIGQCGLKLFNLLNNFKKDSLVTVITSCYAGYIEANIDYEAKFFFCELLPHPLGNVLKTNIQEIWDSASMLSLTYPDKFGLPCAKCLLKKSCRGACRAETFAATGDLYVGNPYCGKGKIISRLYKS